MNDDGTTRTTRTPATSTRGVSPGNVAAWVLAGSVCSIVLSGAIAVCAALLRTVT